MPASNDRIDRTAAGYFLRRDTAEGPRWLIIRATKHGEWGFPKGHLDPGEDLRTAALRECAEETGIALLAVTGPSYELIYDLPSGKRKRVVYYPAVTNQQRVVLSDEHDEHRWASASEAAGLLNHPNLTRVFTRHANAR